jgi:hypothetical protein
MIVLDGDNEILNLTVQAGELLDDLRTGWPQRTRPSRDRARDRDPGTVEPQSAANWRPAFAAPPAAGLRVTAIPMEGPTATCR